MPKKLDKMTLTPEETAAIEALRKVAEIWPETLSVMADDDESLELVVWKEDPKEHGIIREVARVNGIRHED